jgi:predicted nucleic acid-binding protein
MIVADTNLLAYLLIGGPFTEVAQKALLRDKVWIAPPLGRYEFLNVLATSVREKILSKERALLVLNESSDYMRSYDHERPVEVLEAAVEARIGTYDCEFVILARRMGVRLVTADKRLIDGFKDVSTSIEDFAAGK